MIRRSAAATTAPVRRTGLLAAAALLVGLPLVTACGTPHAGAAAVVGGEQITVSALQAKVNEVRDAQAATGNEAQLAQQSGNLSSATLNGMVLDRVVARALDDAGLKVTRAEVQDIRGSQERAAGGAAALRQILLQRYSIAPEQVDDFYRTQVAVEKLARHLHADLGTPQGQQKLQQLLESTGRSMHIDVNPRYGTWNGKDLMLGPTAEKWLKRERTRS